MNKRTKIPRASIQVGILDDEDFIKLTETPKGLTAFGYFTALVVLARDMEMNPLEHYIIRRRLGFSKEHSKTYSNIIQSVCVENGNEPWLICTEESVRVRSYGVWNKKEARGGARSNAGRKPQRIKTDSKSTASGSDSVTDTDTKKKVTPTANPIDLNLMDKFVALLKQIKPDYKITDSAKNKWPDEFRKMREIDKRDPAQIDNVMTWATNDDFWKTNIWSPLKLRKHFDKLDIRSKQPKPGHKTKTIADRHGLPSLK